MKVLDLFCSCGGFSTGFIQAGFDVKWGIDYDKNVQETYEYNHPSAEFILSDIKQLDPSDFRDAEIIIGSPPCVEFSTAKSCRDPFKGFILVKEMYKWIDEIKPKYWIMENVPGVISFLRKEFKTVILNSLYFGIAQVRKRCFHGKFLPPIPEIRATFTTIRDVIGDIMDISPLKPNDIPNHVAMNSSKKTLMKKLNSEFGMHNRYARLSLDTPCYAVTPMHGDTPIIKINGEYRRLSIRECARIQTFPDDFIFFGSTFNCSKMVGNAVPPLLAKRLGESLTKRRLLV